MAGWNAVILDGALKENGMAAFRKWLNEEQTSAIRDYIIQQAHRGQALLKAVNK